jgi:hypothetical protein
VRAASATCPLALVAMSRPRVRTPMQQYPRNRALNPADAAGFNSGSRGPSCTGSSMDESSLVAAAIWTGAVVAILLVLRVANIFRYIPNNQVGIVEKMWAAKGSVRRIFGRWHFRKGHCLATFCAVDRDVPLSRFGSVDHGHALARMHVHPIGCEPAQEGR